MKLITKFFSTSIDGHLIFKDGHVLNVQASKFDSEGDYCAIFGRLKSKTREKDPIAKLP